jgi:hypothetical protein
MFANDLKDRKRFVFAAYWSRLPNQQSGGGNDERRIR